MATHHLKRDIAVILAIKLGIVLMAALFVWSSVYRKRHRRGRCNYDCRREHFSVSAALVA
jgi:hypothetical protein